MLAYQVINGSSRVSQPFRTKIEACLFAKIKGFNKEVLAVPVLKGDLIRDGNDIFIIMDDMNLSRVGKYYPSDPLRI